MRWNEDCLHKVQGMQKNTYQKVKVQPIYDGTDLQSLVLLGTVKVAHDNWFGI